MGSDCGSAQRGAEKLVFTNDGDSPLICKHLYGRWARYGDSKDLESEGRSRVSRKKQHLLTLPMLRQLSFEAQGFPNIEQYP